MALTTATPKKFKFARIRIPKSSQLQLCRQKLASKAREDYGCYIYEKTLPDEWLRVDVYPEPPGTVGWAMNAVRWGRCMKTVAFFQRELGAENVIGPEMQRDRDKYLQRFWGQKEEMMEMMEMGSGGVEGMQSVEEFLEGLERSVSQCDAADAVARDDGSATEMGALGLVTEEDEGEGYDFDSVTNGIGKISVSETLECGAHEHDSHAPGSQERYVKYLEDRIMKKHEDARGLVKEDIGVGD